MGLPHPQSQHSEPHRVSGTTRWALGNARHFVAALNRYVSGIGSIDVLRAYVKHGDAYVAAGHWQGIPRFIFTSDGEIDVEATLDMFREMAAKHAS